MAIAKDRLEKGGRRVVEPTKTVEKTEVEKPVYSADMKAGQKASGTMKKGMATKASANATDNSRKLNQQSGSFPGYNKSKGGTASSGKAIRAKRKAQKKADMEKSVRSFEKEYNDRIRNEKSPFLPEMQYDKYSGETTWESKKKK